MDAHMKLRKILVVIGLVIFVYILSTMDLSKIKMIFASIDVKYLIPCIFTVIPVVLLSNYQWQVLLKHHNMHISFLQTLKNIFIGYFYGFITPGGIGGYTRIIYLHDKTRIPLKKCISNIVLFNTIDFISLLFIGFAGGLILTLRFPQLYTFEVLIVFMIGVVAILMYFFLIKKETLQHFFNVIMRSPFFNPYRDTLDGTIDDFYEDMPQIRDITYPFVLSLFGWILRFFEFYLIAQLFLVSLPILYFIAIVAVADIVATIPITIYGLGTRELTLISLFSLFNIPAENIISLSLFWFVVTWILPSIFGAIVTVSEGKNSSC